MQLLYHAFQRLSMALGAFIALFFAGYPLFSALLLPFSFATNFLQLFLYKRFFLGLNTIFNFALLRFARARVRVCALVYRLLLVQREIGRAFSCVFYRKMQRKKFFLIFFNFF